MNREAREKKCDSYKNKVCSIAAGPMMIPFKLFGGVIFVLCAPARRYKKFCMVPN